MPLGNLLDNSAVVKMGVKEMAAKVDEYVENLHTSYFNLGALLLRVRDEGMHVDWDGTEYEHFDEWCEEVLKFKSRKAQHLISIYKAILDIGPPPLVRDRLLRLGWVKVGQILRVAKTLDELKAWIKIAESLSLRELQSKASFEKLPEDDGDLGTETAKSLTRKFSVTEDQNAVVDKALNVLQHRFPSETDGAKLTMMCLAYLSSHVADSEGGLAVELSYLIKGIEQAFGVKLKIIPQGKPAVKKKVKVKKALVG